MQITVVIDNCNDCRHCGHSGAFTPGGAKAICNHDRAIYWANYIKKGIKEPNNLTNLINGEGNAKQRKKAEAYIHWNRRILRNLNNIPNWCPLKHRGQY